jgi:hypothetical protein
VKVTQDAWTYGVHLGRRTTNLAEAPTFDHILARVADEGRIVCGHGQSCDDMGQGYARILYCLQVSEGLFDLFFNSWSGYRAAHFRSIAEGDAANNGTVTRLTPKLLAFQSVTGVHVDREASLAAPSHKAWCG